MRREGRYQRKARMAKEDRASPRSMALIEREYELANNALLRQRAYCRKHCIHYPMNAWVSSRKRIEGQNCPECSADRNWLRKAAAQLGETAKTMPPADILALAEEMAGHKLYGYR